MFSWGKKSSRDCHLFVGLRATKASCPPLSETAAKIDDMLLAAAVVYRRRNVQNPHSANSLQRLPQQKKARFPERKRAAK